MGKNRKRITAFLGNKRGNAIADIMLVLVVILVVSVTMFFGYHLLSVFNDDIQNDPSFSNVSKTELGNWQGKFNGVYDAIFMSIIVILWVVLIIVSFLIDTHPIFFVVTLLVILFVFAFALFVTELYDTMLLEDEFSGYDTLFPMTNWVMSNLLIIILAMGFSVILVLFGKNRVL